jgi:hypothetical protein
VCKNIPGTTITAYQTIFVKGKEFTSKQYCFVLYFENKILSVLFPPPIGGWGELISLWKKQNDCAEGLGGGGVGVVAS